MTNTNLDELKTQLSRLHSDCFLERALLVELIVEALKPQAVRATAKLLALSKTYVYDELRIAKFHRTYPDITAKERKSYLLIVKRRKVK